MGSIVVITNPNAKHNKKVPDRLARLKAITGDCGVVVETPVPDAIQKTVDRLVARHTVDILGICGGDGTMQQTLTAFINAYDGTLPPLICPLRGGTMNTIANSVGIKTSAEQTLAGVVGKWQQGESFTTSRRNLMKIVMPEETRYCFLFGNGLVANYLDMYYSSPYDGATAGICAITRGIVAAITKNRHYETIYGKLTLKVCVDGTEIPLEQYMGVLAATVKDVGIGFKPLYRAEEREGAFHILCSGLSTKEVIKNLPRFFRGERLRGKDHFDLLATEATIEAKRPFRLMTDGEMTETYRAHITAGPCPKILIR